MGVSHLLVLAHERDLGKRGVWAILDKCGKLAPVAPCHLMQAVIGYHELCIAVIYRLF